MFIIHGTSDYPLIYCRLTGTKEGQRKHSHSNKESEINSRFPQSSNQKSVVTTLGSVCDYHFKFINSNLKNSLVVRKGILSMFN